MKIIDDNQSVCQHCGKPQNPDVPVHLIRPGSILNHKYIVGTTLGEGGFGITYIGIDSVLERKVAIKEYYPYGQANRNNTVSPNVYTAANNKAAFDKGLDSFLKEAKLLAKFSSEPGIVGVIDFFRCNNTAYIIMEYVDGVTLSTHLKVNGILSPEETIRILTPVMNSLGRIHTEGLIHRDISPSNIMISGNQVKLIDFGAARTVNKDDNKSLSAVLKPGYAPEEQYRTKGQQGPWTDVYALSATIYKCLTGSTPDEPYDRMQNETLQPPSALGIPVSPAFDAAIMKGLAILAKDRFQNMSELSNALSAGLRQPAEIQIPKQTAASYNSPPPISDPASRPDSQHGSRSVSQSIQSASISGSRPDDQGTRSVSQSVQSAGNKQLVNPPDAAREQQSTPSYSYHSVSQNEVPPPVPLPSPPTPKKTPVVKIVLGVAGVIFVLFFVIPFIVSLVSTPSSDKQYINTVAESSIPTEIIVSEPDLDENNDSESSIDLFAPAAASSSEPSEDHNIYDNYSDADKNYTSPTRLGDGVFSCAFYLHGAFYQLPMPLNVLLENGWELAGEREGKNPDQLALSGNVTSEYALKHNGEEIHIMLTNTDSHTKYIRYCTVTSAYMIGYFQTNDELGMVFSGHISLGMNEETLLNIINHYLPTKENHVTNNNVNFNVYSISNESYVINFYVYNTGGTTYKLGGIEVSQK